VRLLADRAELTKELGKATTRRSFAPVHDRGQALLDWLSEPGSKTRSHPLSRTRETPSS
jgi:hypothetical protein